MDSSDGKLPVNALSLSTNSCTLGKFPNSVGMLPVSLLEPSEKKYFMVEHKPNSEGIDPDRLLFLNDMNSKIDRFPIEVGMVPLNAWSVSPICFNNGSLPSSVGIVPVIKLSPKCNHDRLVK